jgi:hypothetical protein
MELATIVRSFFSALEFLQEAVMVTLAPDSDSERARQEARLWSSIGLALVIGVAAVAGFAWKNERLQFAFVDRPTVRTVPTAPDVLPLP